MHLESAPSDATSPTTAESDDFQQQDHTQNNPEAPCDIKKTTTKKAARANLVDPMDIADMGLVVSGISGRFPSADNMDELKEKLENNHDMCQDHDDMRWPYRLWGLPPRAGRIKDLSRFDAEFFGYTKDQVKVVEHQLRVLLEVIYESIVDSGVNPATLRGTNTGLFLGLHTDEFEHAMSEEPNFRSQGYRSQLATLAARYFDFRGQVLTFDLACASGFGALAGAASSLYKCQTEQAIVCAVNIAIHPFSTIGFVELQMVSPTGYSRFGDANVDGYVKSEACVSVFLQRKQKALRHYSSILAIGLNADGFKKEGVTFPSSSGQEAIIRELKESITNLHTDHIEYIEAHGTGTPAGDPIECKALSDVYCPKDKAQMNERTIGPLLLGSIKSSMGHSEGASGLCSLAKVILMLENEIIYKSLHFEKPNPNIESLMDGRVEIVTKNRPLKAKIMPMSCYGFGGANVHAILRSNNKPAVQSMQQAHNRCRIVVDGEVDEEGLSSEQTINEQYRLVLMFGRNQQCLETFFNSIMSEDKRDRALTRDFFALTDSLCSDRIDRLMTHRGFMLVNMHTQQELHRSIAKCELLPVGHLSECSNDASTVHSEPLLEDPARPECHFQDSQARRCYFVYPGLGSEWPGMARGLEKCKSFWSTIERLDAILAPLDYSLVESLRKCTKDESRMWSIVDSFVGITAIQIALTNILRCALQVQSTVSAILGHSVGEIACAYADGILNEREAILLAYHLSSTLQENAASIEGSMVAVALSLDEAQKQIDAFEGGSLQQESTTTLYIACDNGPESVTISGSKSHVSKFIEFLARACPNVMHKDLGIDFALHNPHIMREDNIKTKLVAGVRKFMHQGTDYSAKNNGRWLSSHNNLTTTTTTTTTTTSSEPRRLLEASAEYFATNLCTRVNFRQLLDRIDCPSNSVIVEIGPHGTFETLFKSSPELSQASYVKLMKRHSNDDATLKLFSGIGQLFQAGLKLTLATGGDIGSLYPAVELPVGKQVPFVSSLMKWDHTDQHFVPKYPEKFGRTSEKVKVPLDLMDDVNTYLSGHTIEGRILFPATGYLVYAWTVFSFVKRGIRDISHVAVRDEFEPAEFHNVRLHRAIILSGEASTVEVNLESSSGFFEVTEGGQVVADGYIKSPEVNPNGLMYDHVARRLKQEAADKAALKATQAAAGQLPLAELNHNDVYKQFRVNGYDYGETFRCIEWADGDGKHIKIKFNGYLIALFDNILQSIFLTICAQAPQGALFLPTGFDYIRFHSNIILNKIRESGVELRELRSSGLKKFKDLSQTIKTEASRNDEEDTTSGEKHEERPIVDEEPTEEKVCLFETYCDPVLGIIITDGIEMRGVKATPVNRRELTKPLLESYKFVHDVEEPVKDLELSKNLSRERYDTVCANMVFELIDATFDLNEQESEEFKSSLKSLFSGQYSLMGKEELESYVEKRLTVRQSELNKRIAAEAASQMRLQEAQLASADKQADGSSENQQQSREQTKRKPSKAQSELNQVKELAKNEPFSLLSLLDSMLCKFSQKTPIRLDDDDNNDDSDDKASANEGVLSKVIKLNSLIETAHLSIEQHEKSLPNDIMLSSFNTERFIRPMIETIIENTCHSTSNLNLLEINTGSSIFHSHLEKLINDITSNVKLTYTLAHPDPSKLTLNNSSNIRLHTLKNITHASESSLLSLINIDRPIDAICLCDSSYYAVSPMYDIESNGIGPTFNNLTRVIKKGGFLYTMMRYKLSLAERFIMAIKQLDMSNYNLGSSETSYPLSKSRIVEDIIDKVQQIEQACEARIRLLEKEASRCGFELISKKLDTTGCAIYLYKNNLDNQQQQQQQQTDIDLIHVKHGDYAEWLNKLKEEFKPKEKEEDNNSEVDAAKKKQQQQDDSRRKTIWLCAVATKDKPINGIIGMVQCLRRELGNTKNLRCFFDCYSFKSVERLVTIEDIQSSYNFGKALKKDLFWNCVDSNGHWGSFRHLTLDEYYDENQSNHSELGESQLVDTKLAYANVATRGDLSSFRWYEAPSSEGLNEKLVKVHYSALNFRDIMMATGRLPLDAIPLKLAMNDCLLGLEFSGVDIKRKKRIAGMIFSRGIATQMICPEDLSVTIDIPDSMSLKDAATMPCVYMTAIMALICRGKIQPGESILIHAGSGGVGQAAIRLALEHKLTVYTTVGTPEKRKFLLEEFANQLTDDHIFNSRDCSFEAAIMRATRGRGVDLVLNSLADDKLQASVRCLTDNGRFLEIGKYDQAINARLELTRLDINKTFHSIHLDKMFDTETVTPYFKEQVQYAAKVLAKGVQSGHIKPIRHTCFARDEIEQAFRFMATGKHMGKVLIEIEAEPPVNVASEQVASHLLRPGATMRAIPRFQLEANQSYIITGGLGGFGLELIKWLASMGGRHFVVTSRKGVQSGYQRIVLSRLEKNLACKCLVVDAQMADGTTHDGVVKLFQLAKEHSPIKQVGGLFHLAVVLKDNLLDNMTSEEFDQVCKPKADACILLDNVSRKIEPNMSLFVTFSSVSCGKGNAGQINYGYANSVMERICEQRRQDNLHGLAIQWGAIGDVGIAYETLGGNDIVIGGTIPQRMPSCFSTLAKLLCSPFAVCSSIVQVDKKSHDGGTKANLVESVLHVLGIKDISKVDDQTTLGELGLDSLMAVEIRQYIEREYEMTLTVPEIRSLTIGKIREIGDSKDASPVRGPESGADQNKSTVTTSFDKKLDSATMSKIESLRHSGFHMSSGMDVGFQPPLELPKCDFINLNNRPVSAESKPIFVLTHIHGSYERLELVCKNISRPCIGLNYTKELNKMKTFTEIAQYFFDVLENLDWTSEPFGIPLAKHEQQQQQDRVVDLLGYSFGSVISYELLVLIQQQRSQGRTNLVSGQYILLDMSPKLAELMTDMSGSILTTRIDDLLIIYMQHHLKSQDKHKLFDFEKTVNKLKSITTGMEHKFKLVSEILSQSLEMNEQSKQTDLLDAVEAFYRRYQVLFSYKSHKSYVGDATLIRAEEDLISNAKEGKGTPEDYFLSEVINGQVEVHKFPGNHESAVINNGDAIGAIVENKMCSCRKID